jgi:hypothetical protein
LTACNISSINACASQTSIPSNATISRHEHATANKSNNLIWFGKAGSSNTSLIPYNSLVFCIFKTNCVIGNAVLKSIYNNSAIFFYNRTSAIIFASMVFNTLGCCCDTLE